MMCAASKLKNATAEYAEAAEDAEKDPENDGF
jgi:hypothetical protein